MTTRPTPFRTTHVGSLPRPPAVVELMRLRHARGLTHAESARLETETETAVHAAVARQTQIGLDRVNDGEMGKTSYAAYATERLTGFGGETAWRPLADLADFPAFAARYAARTATVATFAPPACEGPVAYRDAAAAQPDLDRLARALAVAGRSTADAFVTTASPGVIAMSHANRHYPTHAAYVAALADAMAVEYRAVIAAGFSLQLDAPDLGMGRHAAWADTSLTEFRDIVALHIATLNQATASLPPERMRLHLCWGNYDGPHHHDVPLRDIVDLVLTARPAGLSFEAANPRHAHEWRVWEDVKLPDAKYLIPGVIDTTTNYIEHPDLVAERLTRFAAIVGPERVVAGADCGLSPIAGYEPVDPDIAWAKLAALVEGARRASVTR